MGEILGLGVTHSPLMLGRDDNMGYFFREALADSGLPDRLRDPASWPRALAREWGDDGGVAAAAAHRAQVAAGFRRARKALDEFRPDIVLVWGDDQYESFKEDVIPAFCIQALNWHCLVGAMEALGRPPDECDSAETWAFVAGKCIAVWRP